MSKATPLRYLHVAISDRDGCEAVAPGEFAGTCGAYIVVDKAEVHMDYGVSYSFRSVHASGNRICHPQYFKYI